MQEELARLEEIIGYRFSDPCLLTEALTHSSYSGETGCGYDYERLEFLGDAVLELLSSEYLYRSSSLSEGELTKRRARMVCEPSLAYVAGLYGYGGFLRLSVGEEKTGGRERSSILCDVTEAILGAVYLDGGLEEARRLVERTVFAHEASLPGERSKDAKTLLQEYVQQTGQELPCYTVTAEEGQPHERLFFVELSYKGEVLGSGQGKSKKAAEQDAAAKALTILQNR